MDRARLRQANRWLAISAGREAKPGELMTIEGEDIPVSRVFDQAQPEGKDAVVQD